MNTVNKANIQNFSKNAFKNAVNILNGNTTKTNIVIQTFLKKSSRLGVQMSS
jgi:hypothetical protein